MKFPWFAPKIAGIALLTFFFVSTCLAQETNHTVRFTIAPGISTPIYFKTLPNSVCLLQTGDLRDAGDALKLFADQDGMIYFNAKPRKFLSVFSLYRPDDDVTTLLMQCTETVDDTTVSESYSIRLRASYFPTQDFPAADPLPAPVGTIRPALADGGLNLSDEDLMKAGYPMRPDPNQAPDAYRRWLELVSRPTTFVTPQTVVRPDVQFAPTLQVNSTNWSGFELLQAYQVTHPNPTGPGQTTPEQYALVDGEWLVPFVDFGLVEIGHTAAALWIGLDDDSGIYEPPISPTCPHCVDLLQGGTTGEAVTTPGGPTGATVVTNYFAWYEDIRGTGNSPPVQNIYPRIRPGDRIFSQIFVANCRSASGGRPVFSDCGPPDPSNSSGLSAVHYIQDITAGWIIPPQVVPINGFSGLSAEWIMERPFGICGDSSLFCNLSDYHSEALGVARMFWAVAETGSGKWIAWDNNQPSGNVDFSMVGCSGPATKGCQPDPTHSLSVAIPSPVNPNVIEFNWNWFH